MDTAFLATFVAVARAGSLAAAADKEHLTANAVAQRIRALEAEFGAPLVARHGRTVRPTEAGHAILARAEPFLAELRALKAAVSGQAIEGELRFGAIATALTGLLPDPLGRLARKYPGLRLYLKPGTSLDLYRQTLAGTLDAATIIRPPFQVPKALRFFSWRKDPLVLLAPADEARTDVRAILATRPVILYDRNQWGGREAALWIDAQGIKIDIRFELDALDAISVLVDRGLGVSVVPDWAGPRPAGINVRRTQLPGPAPQREIGILAPRDGVRMHLLRAVLREAEIGEDDAGGSADSAP